MEIFKREQRLFMKFLWKKVPLQIIITCNNPCTCKILPQKNYIFFSSSAFEENPDTGCYFVGRGGLPNSSGILECDAAVMTGKRCCFGAVAALQG